MYMMIGGDGNEYGPVPEEQLRDWIREGRANGQTKIRPDDGSVDDWRPLGSFPEFASELSPPPGSGTPPPLMADPSPRIETALPSDYPDVNIGVCVSAGFDLLRQNMGLLVGATALFWLIRLVLLSVPVIGGIASLIVMGALQGGLFLVFLKALRGEPAAIPELFSGFGPMFVPLMLVGILTQVLSSLGLVFCILPGVYLIVAWVFAIPLVVDRRLEFWAAMETSRRIVTGQWFNMLFLMIIAFLPAVISMGYSYLVTWKAMNQAVGPAGFDLNRLPQILEQLQPVAEQVQSAALVHQLVLLLTLPLATAILVNAYEILFGRRTAETVR